MLKAKLGSKKKKKKKKREKERSMFLYLNIYWGLELLLTSLIMVGLS